MKSILFFWICTALTLGVYAQGSVDFISDQRYAAMVTYPKSIATGDFNNDSYVDVIVGSSTSNQVAVLPGNNSGKFDSMIVYAALDYSSLVVGDFNLDGNLDFIGVFSSASGAQINLGNGDFTFTTTNLSVASTVTALAAGDFNQDGILDFAIAGSGPADLYIYEGVGNGSFNLTNSFIMTGNMNDVVVGDVNGDGNLDVVVAILANNIALSIGDGLGGFAIPIIYTLPHNCYYLALEDFNNDSYDDVVVLSGTSFTDMTTMLGGISGTLNNFTTITLDDVAGRAVTGDFDRDGNLDLALQSEGRAVAILNGDGNGNFTHDKEYAIGASTRLAVDYLNGDSVLDIVASNGGFDKHISVIIGNPDGSFIASINYDCGNSSYDILAGDFNHDGNVDLVTLNNGSSDFTFLYGDGNGYFPTSSNFGIVSSSTALVVADFDNDDTLDVAHTSGSSYNYVNVLLGHGNGTFTTSTYLNSGSSLYSMATGDLNNDGNIDLVTASYFNDELTILINDGNGVFADSGRYPINSQAHAIITGDFNNDSLLDIVISYSQFDSISILFGLGGAVFAPNVTYSSSAKDLGVGDFNNDGNLDIATNHSVLLGDGTGSFTPGPNLGGSNATAVTVGDFNLDNMLDIATSADGSSRFHILEGNGNGSLSGPYDFSSSYGGFDLVSADFNKDSKLDIATVTAGAFGKVTVLLNRSLSSLQTSAFSTDSIFCLGDTMDVMFTTLMTYDSLNVFYIELSDSNGSFAFPDTIGFTNDTMPVSIQSIIPFSTPPGSGYKVRVVSTSPFMIGEDNGNNLVFQSFSPTALLSNTGSSTFCEGDSTLLVASNGFGQDYKWILDGSLITGAADSSYYTDTSGQYQVIVENSCGVDTSLSIVITVNPSPIVTVAAFVAKCSNDADFLLTGGLPTGGVYSGTAVSGGMFSPSGGGAGAFQINYDYTDSLGCSAGNYDSIVVTSQYIDSTSTFICNGDSIFLANAYQKISGNFVDSMISVGGCDSVINTNLTVDSVYLALAQNDTICDGDSILIFGVYQSLPGVYFDTLSSGGGCDSIISKSLITNTSSTSFSATACESYMSPSGNYIWTISGNYVDTVPAVSSCDSVISINLTINTNSNATMSLSVCDSLISPSGSYTWFSSGVFMDTIPTVAGCDSVITVNLTVTSVDASVNQVDSVTLAANAVGSIYQWLDCSSGNAILVGDTSQNFIATETSSYAVQVTTNGCVDTSECYNLIWLSIVNNDLSTSLTISPNPNGGEFTINMNVKNTKNWEISVFNNLGQEIVSKKYRLHKGLNELRFDLNGHPSGIYNIQFISDSQTMTRKVIIE